GRVMMRAATNPKTELMETWQADLLKVGVSAVIAGIAGVWGHWRWTREARIKNEDIEGQRQAEYEAFKKRRRLIGAGEVERMERAARLTEILVTHREHRIT